MISIIIPVYNVGPYIEQCLKSIAMQTYRLFEIILIDDGSSDDSYKICLQFKTEWPEIDITIFRKENEGVSAARKDGIRLAKGEWITFVDGDDTLLPESLLSLISAAKPNTGIVLGAHCKNYPGGEIKFFPNMSLGKFSAFEYIKINLRGAFEGAPWAKLFKKEVLTDYVFDLPREIKNKEDFIMNMRIAVTQQFDVVFIEDPVYCYLYNRNDSALTQYQGVFKLDYELRVLDYLIQALKDANYYNNLKNDIANMYLRNVWGWRKNIGRLNASEINNYMRICMFILKYGFDMVSLLKISFIFLLFLKRRAALC